jgi:hypothetical protein
MPTYTGTAFSHIGFSIVLIGLVMIAAAGSNATVRAALAVFVAVAAGWASLASSEFNRASAVYAREQGVKWTVIRDLAACRDRIPAPFFGHVTAPRLWSFTTGGMAWIHDGTQYQHYWDLFASTRYGLKSYFYMRPQASPKALNFLDYRLAQDGSLLGIVMGVAPDGIHFQDVFIVKDSSTIPPAKILAHGSTWMYQGPENTSFCNVGLQIVRFTGPDLNLSTAEVYDLPNTDQISSIMGK